MSSNLVIPEHELPKWMKQAQRGIDWGAILVIGFCLLVAWPFITRNNLSAINNTEHYVYQTADYASALKEGQLYPRWSPHVLSGYGAPIPNFYPPGAAYSAAVLDVLFTNDAIAAVRIIYIMAIVLAGSMVYAFMKQQNTALSALLAAMLYVFSPFIAYTVPHIQGDLPLAIGITLLPTLLWAVNRLLIRNHSADYVMIAIICAAIIVTKPAILPQGIFLSATLITIHFSRKVRWKQVWLILSAMMAGIGLSAFYWMPALLESRFMKWIDALIDARHTALTPGGLFERTQAFASTLLIQEPQFNIGWVLIGFTVLTIITIGYYHHQRQFSVAFLLSGLVLIIIGLIVLPQNTELLAGIVLCLALAASHSISLHLKNKFGYGLTLVAAMLIFVEAIPIWNIPEPQMLLPQVDATAQYSYESNGWGIAVLPPGQAIPSFVSPTNPNLVPIHENLPETNGRILKDISFQTSLLEESTFRGRYQVITQDKTTLSYLRAYAPGWQAFLDEQALEVFSNTDGLIQVTIPAGTNAILTFSYGSTRIRIMAWFVSVIATVVMVYVWWERWQRLEMNFDTGDLLGLWQIRLFMLMLLIGAIIRYPPTYNFLKDYLTLPSPSMSENTIEIKNTVERRFQLSHFSLEEQHNSIHMSINLRLYWKLLREMNAQNQVRIRVISRQNQSTALTTEFRYPGQFPTNRWILNLDVLDEYQLELPQDLANSNYTIMVDVASCPEICLQGTVIVPQTITTIQLPTQSQN